MPRVPRDLLVLFPGGALSGAGEPAAAGPDLARYFVVCGALVVGVALLGLVLRRFVARGLRARAAQRSLQVLDVLPLGGRQRLLVVRCYDRSFLLGQGDKELRAIAELDPVGEDGAVAVPLPPRRERPETAVHVLQPEPGGFGSALSRELRRARARGGPATSGSAPATSGSAAPATLERGGILG